MHVTFALKSAHQSAHQDHRGSELRELFDRECERIERRISKTPADTVSLHAEGAVNPHLKECYFTLSIALPSARLAAHGVGATLAAALRDATAELLREIDRHRRRLSRSSSARSEFKDAVQRDGFEAFSALEHVETEDPRIEIEKTLPQLLQFLTAELKRHGLWEKRAAYRVDVRELADEAVLHALEKKAAKPPTLTFGRFLIGCAYDVVLGLEDRKRARANGFT